MVQHERHLLTLAQAARRLGVAPQTLSGWIARGAFPAYKTPGGHYRIAVEDLALAFEKVRASDAAGSAR